MLRTICLFAFASTAAIMPEGSWRSVLPLPGGVQISFPPAVLDVPKVAPESSARPTKAVTLRRSDDGLFYVNAAVNGSRVRFVVDTGANVVVLSKRDARRIGTGSTGRSSHLSTASGSARMRWTRLRDVRIGHHRLKGVDAAIIGEEDGVSLLGQNALAQFDSVRLTGDEMVID